MDLLKTQKPWVGKYWSLYTDEIDNFRTGASVIGTAWPYQVNALQGEGKPIQAVVPSEGMTGWADTWMMSSHAKHPNCMQKWMAWMLSPRCRRRSPSTSARLRPTPRPASTWIAGYGSYAVPGLLRQVRRQRPDFYSSDRVLEDAGQELRRRPRRHLHRLPPVDRDLDDLRG